MLQPDPTLRLSATEALRHPWITGPQDDAHLDAAHGKMREKVDDKARRGSAHKSSGVLGFLFRRQSLLK